MRYSNVPMIEGYMTKPVEGRPNVVFVFTDQQSADMMSCAGNEYLDTPAMDELAETGVRFDRAYCANPICSPSRVSLLTGRFPSAIGLESNEDSHIHSVPDAVTAGGLGHHLREAGYQPVYGGKEHLPADMTVESLGFDRLTRDRRDGLASDCAEFLREDHDEPFCLVASFINPHDICYMGIRDYRRVTPGYEGYQDDVAEATLDDALERPDDVDEETFFEERCPPLPPNHEPQADEPEAVRQLVENRPFKAYIHEEWSAERWREHRWAYARLTEFVDAQIATLVDALKDSDRWDDTVVVFASDHGDMDAAHRLEHKTVFYEESVNVPFVVRDPRSGQSGVVDDRLVSLLDVFPTLCDYAGVDAPDHCAGRSLGPLVANDDSPEDCRDAVRIESGIGEALVTDRYKYALHDVGKHREQLYDRREDPGEMENAATDSGTDEVVADLRQRLVEGSNRE
jgi:choline-sulfatase